MSKNLETYNPVTGNFEPIPDNWDLGRADALVERQHGDHLYGVAITGPNGRLVPCRWINEQWKTIRLPRRRCRSYFQTLGKCCSAMEPLFIQPAPTFQQKPMPK